MQPEDLIEQEKLKADIEAWSAKMKVEVAKAKEERLRKQAEEEKKAQEASGDLSTFE